MTAGRAWKAGEVALERTGWQGRAGIPGAAAMNVSSATKTQTGWYLLATGEREMRGWRCSVVRRSAYPDWLLLNVRRDRRLTADQDAKCGIARHWRLEWNIPDRWMADRRRWRDLRARAPVAAQWVADVCNAHFPPTAADGEDLAPNGLGQRAVEARKR